MSENLENVGAEGVSRTNLSMAGESDEVAAHYLEAEMREVRGETRGCVRWPTTQRLKKVRGWLTGLRNSIEASRKKWCRAEASIEAKRKQVTEEIILKTLRSEERRKTFEARWNEVKERNKKKMDEGSVEGPIVPIGLRPPEPPKMRKLSHEAPAEGDAKPKTFVRKLDEAPEIQKKPEIEKEPEAPGAKGVVEGGGSGSGDAWAPPASEAPVAPPSKAEEVRMKLAAAPLRLDKKAYVDLEDEFIAVATLEDLRPQDRKQYEFVRATGAGVCGRCRWSTGCDQCDSDHAWSFLCRTTLWHTADEAVRPKAKPRGRPKKPA